MNVLVQATFIVAPLSHFLYHSPPSHPSLSLSSHPLSQGPSCPLFQSLLYTSCIQSINELLDHYLALFITSKTVRVLYHLHSEPLPSHFILSSNLYHHLLSTPIPSLPYTTSLSLLPDPLRCSHPVLLSTHSHDPY